MPGDSSSLLDPLTPSGRGDRGPGSAVSRRRSKPVRVAILERFMNNNNKLKVFSGRANIRLAENIANVLGDTLGKVTLSNFPDGEVSVRIEEDVRGRDNFLVQPTCPPGNGDLMELLIMLDSFRRASAARITLGLPYYGYPRQDC